MRAGAARAEQPEAVREALVPALLGGAASHHAGALPAWKSLVEGLFQRGLLKATARPARPPRDPNPSLEVAGGGPVPARPAQGDRPPARRPLAGPP